MVHISWRLKRLAQRAQHVALYDRRFSAMDALMSVTAFADLRIRGPEVHGLCFKSCVTIAARQRQHKFSVGMIVQFIAALATLQARRRIPALRASLLVRLLELNIREHHPKTLQLAAISAIKLGSDQLDSNVINHLLSTILQAHQQNPSDHALLVAASALMSLPNSRVMRALAAVQIGRSDVTVVSILREALLESLAHNKGHHRMHGDDANQFNRDIQWLTSTSPMDDTKSLSSASTIRSDGASAVRLVLQLTTLLNDSNDSDHTKAVRGGGGGGLVERSRGNDVFQLMQLFSPLTTLYCLLNTTIIASSSLSASDERAGTVVVNSSGFKTSDMERAVQEIQQFVRSVPLVRCVPGGFATFMHDALPPMIAASSSSAIRSSPPAVMRSSALPFVRRLIIASSDREFAKGFNSFDVAKLADGLRLANWDECWLALPFKHHVNNNNNGATTVRVLGDALCDASQRLVDDVVYFARNGKHGHTTTDGNSNSSGSFFDSIAFSSVLRLLQRLCQACQPQQARGAGGGGGLSDRQRTELFHRLLKQCVLLCRGCVLDVQTPLEQLWAPDSCSWAMLILTKTLSQFTSVAASFCGSNGPHIGSNNDMTTNMLQEAQGTMMESIRRLSDLLTLRLKRQQQQFNSQRRRHSGNDNVGDHEGSNSSYRSVDGGVDIREAVQALFVGSSMLSLQPLEMASSDIIATTGASTSRRAREDQSNNKNHLNDDNTTSFLNLCEASVAGHQWVVDGTARWASIPSTEWSMLLQAIGALSSISPGSSIDSSGARSKQYHHPQLWEHVAALGNSFLSHVAFHRGLTTPTGGGLLEEEEEAEVHQDTDGTNEFDAGRRRDKEVYGNDTSSPFSSSSTSSRVEGAMDPVSIVDALCVVVSWIGKQQQTRGSSAIHNNNNRTTSATPPASHTTTSIVHPSHQIAAVRVLFNELLSVPHHTMPMAPLIQLLDGIARNRGVLLLEPTAGAAILLRSDIRRLWMQQMLVFEPHAARRSASTMRGQRILHASSQLTHLFTETGSTAADDEYLGLARGLMVGDLSLLCHAAACLKVLGFTLLPAEADASSSLTDAMLMTTSHAQHQQQQQQRSFTSGGGGRKTSSSILQQNAAAKRRIPIPTSWWQQQQQLSNGTSLTNSPHIQLARHASDIVHIVALVAEQRDRLQSVEWSAWGAELCGPLSRVLAHVDARSAIVLLRALRANEVVKTFMPRMIDRTTFLQRCEFLCVGGRGTSRAADNASSSLTNGVLGKEALQIVDTLRSAHLLRSSLSGTVAPKLTSFLK